VFDQLVHSGISPLQHGLVEVDNVRYVPPTLVDADVCGLVEEQVTD